MRMRFLLSTILLCAASVGAQELPSKPSPQVPAAQESKSSWCCIVPGMKPMIFERYEPPKQEMVWGGINGEKLLPVNSCAWCGRPISFRQAAFDKKALLMWGAATALAVADTETALRHRCFREGRCREGNPLLGNSRGQQYGVRMSFLGFAWMATAYLRKGDRAKNVGGFRHWWLLPIPYQVLPAIGIGRNAGRR